MTSDNYKRYEVFELKEDVLVLSATWKRLRNEKKFQGSISKLVDHTLFSEIQPEDREQANSIRDYYSKKVMMLKLKGKRLTNFREDLNSFIHSDGTMVKEGMFPLVYRLPEFYEYDRTIDDRIEWPSDFSDISSEMLEKCNKSLLACIDEICKLIVTINPRPYHDSQSAFEIFGPDIMLDSNGKAWIFEINKKCGFGIVGNKDTWNEYNKKRSKHFFSWMLNKLL
jgi:hypothetical protein